MASRTLPGIGLQTGWALGENGWKEGMDANLQVLTALVNTAVENFVASLPGSPVDGTFYVVTTGANTNRIAMRDQGGWTFFSPKEGFKVFNKANDRTYYFSGTIWVDQFEEINENVDLAIQAAESAQGVTAGRALVYPDVASPNDIYDANGRKIGSLGTALLDDQAPNKGQMDAAIAAATAALAKDFFYKPQGDKRKVAWTQNGAGGIKVKGGVIIEVGGTIHTYHTATDVVMPMLTGNEGGQLQIWISPDGTPRANFSKTVPPIAGARHMGGVHYAPGGNAPTGNSGGDDTPQINPYSFWDHKFRPSCENTDCMTLVADWFWADIYLLNTRPDLYGTSAYGRTIATGGSTRPTVPSMWELTGDADDIYARLNWWDAQEVMSAHGKQCMNYAEFCAFAFGVIEEQQRDGFPGTTGLNHSTGVGGGGAPDEQFTSKWGGNLSVGAHWVWGRELNYGIWESAYSLGDIYGRRPGDIDNGYITVYPEYFDITTSPGQIGRGSIVQENLLASRGALFGSKSNNGIRTGSRCLDWANAIQTYSASISARGMAQHVIVE